MNVFKFQLGQFFLVIGVFALAVFLVTVQSQSPLFSMLFGGVVCAILGISLMMRNGTRRAEESARFRRVRHALQKSRERREKKRQKQQERRERASQNQQTQRQGQSQQPRERQEQQEPRERQS